MIITGSESDNLTHYAKVLKKFNGLADGITEDEDETSTAAAETKTKLCHETTANLVSITNGSKLDATIQQNLRENLYEVSVWYEDNEMKLLAVERLDKKKLDEGSSASVTDTSVADVPSDDTTTTEKTAASSSNGSVGSVSPYKLPEAKSTVASQSQSSDGSSIDVKFAIPALPQPPRTKHTVKGVVALCNFMIDHFGKIKKSFVNDDDDVDDDDNEELSTPTTGRGRKKKTADVTPKSSATKRGAPTKRSLDKSPSDDDGEPKAKQTKSTNKKSTAATTKLEQQTPTKDNETENEEQHKEYSVMARWVDKLYYAGRVTEAKPGNRFVVLFEDGASKVLQHDYIVFGEENGILPLLNQSVHALIKKDTYEPGIVTETKRDGDKIFYTVETESKTVTVTSSDLYLEDDQAKAIQNVTKDVVLDLLKTPDTPSSKRAGRPSAKLEESQATSSTRGRPKKPATAAAAAASQSSAPEPGFSGNVAAGGSGSGRKGRKPNKRYS